MDLPHAIIASGLAARATERRDRSTEAEIREAEERVTARLRRQPPIFSPAGVSTHHTPPTPWPVVSPAAESPAK